MWRRDISRRSHNLGQRQTGCLPRQPHHAWRQHRAEDNYDFNDDGSVFSQPLGFWNFDGIAPSLLGAAAHNAGVDAVSRGIMQQSLFGMSAQNQRRYIDEQRKRYVLVLNSHFADYRARYKRGGDFRVFSDLLREPLPPGTPAITLPKR